jgi:acyl-CoA synthetase (AMP-forming)/AMP-acid ligase II/acyl carrier protein
LHVNNHDLNALLIRSCELFADRSAIQCPGQDTLSYAALHGQLRVTRSRFKALGIGTDDRIAVILPQGPENAVLCLAAMSYACCVPFNPDSKESHLADAFTRLGIHFLVTASGMDQAGRHAASAAGVRTIDLVRTADGLAGEFVLKAQDEPWPAARSDSRGVQDPARPVLILHTSGSTAAPKAVPLTAKNLLASVENLVTSLALTPESVALNMMPLFHIGALVDLTLSSLRVGGAVICTRDMSARTFHQCLHQLRPTWYQAVPTMMQDVVSHARRRGLPTSNSSLRFCRAVSARLPQKIRDDFVDCFGVPVIEIYGMTETAGVITSNRLPPHGQKQGSVGIPAGTAIQIIDGSGNKARTGQKGEVLVAGDNVFSGYFAAEEINRISFVGGWFRTGDEGYIDTEGHLFLTGRLKDIINRGGEKISSLQVDECLQRYPTVSDAACFPLPHPTLGEDVAAAVVLAEGKSLDDAGIRAFMATQLPGFMLPGHYFVVDSLPRTAAGKLQRYILPQILHPAGNAPQVSRQKPQSPAGQLIARLWSDILAVDDVGKEDNFFDLGGDSLKAAVFMTELEAQIEIHLDAGALYDHPTLDAFEAHVLVHLARDNKGARPTPGSLPAEVFDTLARFMAAWPGTRQTPHALMAGHNTLGARPALFWGCQDQHELTGLARQLGHEQPVYGFRSLFKTGHKSDINRRLAAAHYAQEILQIQPQGPYFVAGYCEAGKMAFEIAQQLTRQGHLVQLLALVEQFVPETYAGRTALFFCPEGRHSPYHYFQHPEMGWRKYYSGAISLIRLPVQHLDILAESHLPAFAAHLNHELHMAQLNQPSGRCLPESRRPQVLDCLAYRATIVANVPRLMVPGARLELLIGITNTSAVTWPEYECSGIALASRWQLPNGDTIGISRDGFSALPIALSPGQHFKVSMSVQVPEKTGPWILELDLTDQGICWFQERGSQAVKFPVRVSKFARLWPGLRKLKFGIDTRES